MKRDMDLVRELLLWMEGRSEHAFFLTELPSLSSRETMIAHAQILQSGGFLEQGQPGVLRISWSGYEFLEKVRDPEIWRNTKAGAAKLGSWSVKILGEIAGALIRSKAASLGIVLD